MTAPAQRVEASTANVHAPRVSVVVNYYNPSGNTGIAAMTLFAVESLQANTINPLELIVSDGSGTESRELAARCAERGWVYIASDRSTGFAECYNTGMRRATGDYRAWMASDIMVPAGWDRALITEMERTGAWMALPYLTSSDYPAQMQFRVARMVTFAPSAMTFNLNLMTAHCVDAVGLMDEQFSGTFNDIDYLIRLRRAGGEVIVAYAGQVLHVARATVRRGTTAVGDVDLGRFLAKYPKMASPSAAWQYDIVAAELCRSPAFRILTRAAAALPFATTARRAAGLIERLEPLFHRI